MTETEIYDAALQESNWLHYYGFRDDRMHDEFSVGFYDRITSIGYTKKIIPLPLRCACLYITSDGPVLESKVEDLVAISGPRNTSLNIITALEYALEHSLNRAQLINIIKS